MALASSDGSSPSLHTKCNRKGSSSCTEISVGRASSPMCSRTFDTLWSNGESMAHCMCCSIIFAPVSYRTNKPLIELSYNTVILTTIHIVCTIYFAHVLRKTACYFCHIMVSLFFLNTALLPRDTLSYVTLSWQLLCKSGTRIHLQCHCGTEP